MGKQELALVTTNGHNKIQNVQQPSKLPSIAELRKTDELDLTARENELNVLLNELPDPSWIQSHPMISSVKYIRIARLEWLMTRIFIEWHVEIISWSLVANSIGVTVRVHYKNPITNEWKWTDGVGAVALQTDSGASATDFAKIKSAAVQMSLPAAKSYAFKDAVENLGRLFGRDLNRKDQLEYLSFLEDFNLEPREVELIENLITSSGADKPKFLEFMKVESVAEIRKSDYKKALMALSEKVKRNAQNS